MIIIIHDRKDLNGVKIPQTGKTHVIPENDSIKPCICCFDCWVKTPGECTIKDGFENLGLLMSKCEKLIIISECFYGSYSPFVKNVLDRSACPSLLPFFTVKNGETHHPKRYKNNVSTAIHFYGTIPQAEKETAKKLIKANRVNLYSSAEVFFHDSFDDIKEV